MSQLLIYFIDENVDPQIQAADLEEQISENLFNMDETEGQRVRNVKVADLLSDKFPDLHQYEDVSAEEFENV